MGDVLMIRDLAAECHVGVFEWEQRQAQTIWLDVDVEIDAAEAARHDTVDHTLDYGRLVTALTRRLKERTYRLLETLAEDAAGLILKEFATPQVRLRAKKRALPGIDLAAVEIVRRGSLVAVPSARAPDHT